MLAQDQVEEVDKETGEKFYQYGVMEPAAVGYMANDVWFDVHDSGLYTAVIGGLPVMKLMQLITRMACLTAAASLSNSGMHLVVLFENKLANQGLKRKYSSRNE